MSNGTFKSFEELEDWFLAGNDLVTSHKPGYEGPGRLTGIGGYTLVLKGQFGGASWIEWQYLSPRVKENA